MSARRIRREHARRRARRGTLAASAAVAATLALAPAAQANDFVVDSLGDGPADACDPGACTLRDALAQTSGLSNDDTITFASNVTGTIRLTAGELLLTGNQGKVTIIGPGSSALSISGDADDSGTANAGDSRIFNFDAPPNNLPNVAISGLTLTEGFPGAGAPGGAIRSLGSLELDDVVIAGNEAQAGGGIYFNTPGPLDISDSEIKDNDATGDVMNGRGGGISVAHNMASVKVDATTISGNAAGGSGGGLYTSAKYGGMFTGNGVAISDSQITDNGAQYGGGITSTGGLYINDSEVSGNEAAQDIGGIDSGGKYAELQLQGVSISGNTAAGGVGGIAIASNDKYGTGDPGRASGNQISDSTIAGNKATAGSGGGIQVAFLGENDTFLLDHSSVSGNDATFGGGVQLLGPVENTTRVQDSTISGNSADKGGGVAIGRDSGATAPPVSGSGSLDLYNSTIADNSASVAGGGVYLANYEPAAGVSAVPVVRLYSDIVGDNTANGSPEDLFTEATTVVGNGFFVGYSLIEDDGGSSYIESPTGSNVVGSDPKLGALGDNGGPTETQVPATDSPVVDSGANPLTLTTDQRGFPREFDQPVGPDPTTTHTDIGAVELRGAGGTVIDSGPPASGAPANVSFTFSSEAEAAKFECSLDGAAFAACTSPQAYTALTDGQHTFSVRSVVDGTPDPTPASATFSVNGGTGGTGGDTTPPKVTITKGPKKTVKTKKGKAKVKLAFTSDEAGSTFECKVDKKAFKPCRSPLKVKLKAKPGKGLKHTISVRAIDAAQNVGSAVTVKTRVVKKPKK